MSAIKDSSLQEILDALYEIRADVNALRLDLLRHDHGDSDTYATAAMRFNSSVNSLITGVASATVLDFSPPTLAQDCFK